MAHARTIARRFLGGEVTRLRKQAKLTQEQLGEQLRYSRSQIASVEGGWNLFRYVDVKKCDKILNAGGLLERAWHVANNENVPPKFRVFLEDEARAAAIHVYEQMVPPGLLQDRDFMRALLSLVFSGKELEAEVEARISRQAILDGENPPNIRAVLEESALRRLIGGKKVTKGQLQHLLNLGERPNITIQVVPTDLEDHPCLDGPFTIFEDGEGGRSLYYEGQGGGGMIHDTKVIADLAYRLNKLSANTLSPRESAKLIRRLMEEL